MRAIGVTRYGGPEALHEVKVDPEPLRLNSVRVRTSAAAVNPTDILLRRGMRDHGPRAATVAVPGMDVCGTVTEIGYGVENRLAIGQRVMAVVVTDGEHGAYRDEVVLPSGSVVAAPAGFSDPEVASVPMNALTACHALEMLSLPAGSTFAVTGAAGGLGGVAIELAKASGLTVIADATAKDKELVTRLGADIVVPRGAGFAAAVRMAVPGGVDALLDAAVRGPEVTSAVRDAGSFVTVRLWTGGGDRRLKYRPVLMRPVAERLDMLEWIVTLLRNGRIQPRVAALLAPTDAPEAHRRLEAGGVRGRLVLDFS